MASSVGAEIYTLILEACIKLEVTAVTTAHACVYFHRFSASTSGASGFCKPTMAAVCIHLASKVWNDRAKVRDVVNVVHRILHPAPEDPLDLTEEYWSFRDGLGRLEFVLLRALQFNLSHDYPHLYFLQYAISLRGWMDRDQSARLETATALGFTALKDAYAVPALVLRHPAKLFALAMLYLVLKHAGLEEKVPLMEREEWFEVLRPGTSRSELERVGHEFEAAVYALKDVES